MKSISFFCFIKGLKNFESESDSPSRPVLAPVKQNVRTRLSSPARLRIVFVFLSDDFGQSLPSSKMFLSVFAPKFPALYGSSTVFARMSGSSTPSRPKNSKIDFRAPGLGRRPIVKESSSFVSFTLASIIENDFSNGGRPLETRAISISLIQNARRRRLN